jgi:hypothetical protein
MASRSSRRNSVFRFLTRVAVFVAVSYLLLRFSLIIQAQIVAAVSPVVAIGLIAVFALSEAAVFVIVFREWR